MKTDEFRQLAISSLEDGLKVPEIEHVLTAKGVRASDAARIVDEALQMRIAESRVIVQTSAGSWVLVAVGLLLAMGPFGGMYFLLVNAPESVARASDTANKVIRGAIFGGGGALAVGGLKMVYTQLKLLLG